MKFNQILLWLFLFPAFSSQANDGLPRWMTDGPKLKDSSAAFELPIQVIGTKLYLMVELGGKPRRFVLDTGSPSMIDTALVNELGLKVVGTNNGRDAHGAIIKTNIVQTSIRLGNTLIENLSMMSADFSASEVTKLFIGDGVLGSDILPLGAWQIDLKNKVFRFNTNLKELPNLKNARKLKLYQFGYPFMPIFDVQFAKKARSKAMFDTGAPTFFSISSRDLEGTQKASGIGKTKAGFGSPGTSLGGQAPNTQLLQVELKNLAIDSIKLGNVTAVKREHSPSLIGSRILENYIITLDSRSNSAYFSEYSNISYSSESFGFSLAFDENISIAAVWDDSPAKKAGLQPGLVLTSINGLPVDLTKAGLLRAIRAMEAKEIELTWNTGATKLNKERVIP